VPQALPANRVALLAALLRQNHGSISRVSGPDTARGTEEYDPSETMRDRHRVTDLQLGGHGAEPARRI